MFIGHAVFKTEQSVSFKFYVEIRKTTEIRSGILKGVFQTRCIASKLPETCHLF